MDLKVDRTLWPPVALALTLNASLFAWANPTHQMIAKELTLLDSLPAQCYSDEFIISNNAPDLFSVDGPEFAHSDYRFAGILYELVESDSARLGYVYGYFAHIAADAVIHSEYLTSPGIEHRLKEMAISSVRYYSTPELRAAAERVTIRYYPQLLVEASKRYVERYRQGRVLGVEEMRENARVLALGMIAQQFLLHSRLVAIWARNYQPEADWLAVYNRSVDSAYHLLQQFPPRQVFAQTIVARELSRPSQLRELASLGEEVCAAGLADLEESSTAEFTEIAAQLTDDAADYERLLSLLSSKPERPLTAALVNALSRLTDSDRCHDSKARITLSPAYPNPFNDATCVQISSDVFVDNVAVTIFNLQGQSVCRLLAGGLHQGVYDLVWLGKDGNGNSVASGVYFVVVRSPEVMYSRKLLLLK